MAQPEYIEPIPTPGPGPYETKELPPYDPDIMKLLESGRMTPEVAAATQKIRDDAGGGKYGFIGQEVPPERQQQIVRETQAMGKMAPSPGMFERAGRQVKTEDEAAERKARLAGTPMAAGKLAVGTGPFVRPGGSVSESMSASRKGPAGGGYLAGLQKKLQAIADAHGQGDYYSKAMALHGQQQALLSAQELRREEDYQKYQRDMANYEFDLNVIHQDAQLAYDKRMTAIKDATETYRQARSDPGRLIRNNKGMAALAIALGAIGQAFMLTQGHKGARNMGLDAINEAVDRDIRAQELEIEKLGKEIDIAGNLLQLTMRAFDRKEDAKMAARLMRKEEFLRAGEYMLSQETNEQKALAGQANMLELRHELDNEQRNFKMGLFNQELKIAQLRQGEQKLSLMRKAAMAKAAPGPMPPGMAMADPRAMPPTKDDFQKAKPLAGAYRYTRGLIAELAAWRKDKGFTLTGEDLTHAEQMRKRVMSGMRIIDKSGARIEEAEKEMMGLDFNMGGVGWVHRKLLTLLSSVDKIVNDELYYRNIRLTDVPGLEEGLQFAD